jgi:hypothetical protein
VRTHRLRRPVLDTGPAADSSYLGKGVNYMRKTIVHNDPLDLKNQARANRPIIVIIVSA